jgi:uncharacterized membrane protein YesL
MKGKLSWFLFCKQQGGMEMYSVYRLVASAVCIAFGVALPVVFHMAGTMGIVFLPMHLPVLIAGLFLGAEAGFFTGVITPLLSSLMTGMPPLMPMLPPMAAELGAYGWIGGYLYEKRKLPLLVSLAGAMIAGRLAGTAVVWTIALFVQIQLTPAAYLKGAVLTGLPGIIIQLLVVPLLVPRLQAALPRKK